MSTQTAQAPTTNLQDTIRILQEELEQTNREVLLLTLHLDRRVEERTAELRSAQEELQRKNAELVRRTSQLEAANKELEAFSYSISHDLRAPLRHIKGYLEIMIEEGQAVLDESARNYVDRAFHSVEQMGKLIDDLLAFSRTGRIEMRQTRVSMSELVDEVIREMSIDTKGRKIEWDIQPLPSVTGDRALLKQVWVNLLSNAVKYSRPRDPAKISVGFASPNGELQFNVTDNGVGFEMRYVNRLFGVFQRLHGPSEFEGTGIGLANVRQIIRRHGGRTWAEGETEKGATFYFTLPQGELTARQN